MSSSVLTPRQGAEAQALRPPGSKARLGRVCTRCAFSADSTPSRAQSPVPLRFPLRVSGIICHNRSGYEEPFAVGWLQLPPGSSPMFSFSTGLSGSLQAKSRDSRRSDLVAGGGGQGREKRPGTPHHAAFLHATGPLHPESEGRAALETRRRRWAWGGWGRRAPTPDAVVLPISDGVPDRARQTANRVSARPESGSEN